MSFGTPGPAERGPAERRPNRLGSGALILAVLLAMGAAVIFARADQVDRIGADAAQLGIVQASVAETAVHRASLVIAFASLRNGDKSDLLTLQAADEAVTRASRIAALVAAMEPELPELTALANEVVASTRQARAMIADGEIAAASSHVESETLPIAEELESALTSGAAVIAGRIEGERAEAGRLARATSYVVALLVPALAVAGFRRSSRRRSERERLEAEVVRQRELSEAKDQLIAGLSHQLRTPLTGIYGYADLLLSRPDPETIREGTEAILAESGDLRRMIDDILITARVDSTNLTYKPVMTDVEKAVERAIAHYERLGIHIKVDCAAARFPVDGGRLEHVLRNVIANAVKHGEEPIEITGRLDGDRYNLAVIDGGAGLDATVATDPFAAFANPPKEVTVRNSLGLGLSVARMLVEGMGGRIEYIREEGRTVFSLSLPTSG